MSYRDPYSSDDEANNKSAILKNSIPKRRGWDGENLEFERVQPKPEDVSLHAAVNIEQFRNHQIGIGYQAKHVIRQPTETTTAVVVHDKSKSPKQLRSESCGNSNPKKTRLQRYIKCDGLRAFRKELASIEN